MADTDDSLNQSKPPLKPKPTISKSILNRIRNADFKNAPVRYSSNDTLTRGTSGDGDERTTQSMFIESPSDPPEFTKLKNESRNTVFVAEVEKDVAQKIEEDITVNDDKIICKLEIDRQKNNNEEIVEEKYNANSRGDGAAKKIETCNVAESNFCDPESNTCEPENNTCDTHTFEEHPYANVDYSLDDDNVYENLEPGCEFANQCSSAKRNSQEPANKLPVPPPRRSKSFQEQGGSPKIKEQKVKKNKVTSPVQSKKHSGKKQKRIEHSESLPSERELFENNHNCVVNPDRPYGNIRPTPVIRQKKFDQSSCKRDANRTSSNSPVARRKEKVLSSADKKDRIGKDSFKSQTAISANSALDTGLVEITSNDSTDNSKPPIKPKPPKRRGRKERSKTINPEVPDEILSTDNDRKSSTLAAPPRKYRSKSVETISKDKLNLNNELNASLDLNHKVVKKGNKSDNSINIKSDKPKEKTTKRMKSQESFAKPRRPAPPPPTKSKSCEISNSSLTAKKDNNPTYAVVEKNRKESVKSEKKPSKINLNPKQPSTPHKVISETHTFSFSSDVIDSKTEERDSEEICNASAGPEATNSQNNTDSVLENTAVEQLKSPLSRDNSGSSGRGSFHSNENRNSGESKRNSGLSDDYVLPDIKPFESSVDEQIYVNHMASPDIPKKATAVSPALETRSIPIKNSEKNAPDGYLEGEQVDGYEDMTKLTHMQKITIYSVPRQCSHTSTEDGKCECADFTESSGDEDGGSLSDEMDEYGNYEPISDLTESTKQMKENVEMTPENKRKVLLVAKEIRDSERVFVDVLKLLNEDFRTAIGNADLITSRPVIDKKVLDQILGHLPQLQMFNETLLDDLEKRIEKWEDNPRLADIFLKKGPYLKLYTSYIRDFERVCSIFDEACTKYTFFGQVVRDFEASPRCMHLAVKHYMLKPIQRIPQYKLLLTDYLKKLNSNSDDYAATQDALKIVSEVANHANETMRQGDNFEKLLQIQHSLMGNHEIVKPGRIYKKEGILLKLSRKVMQPRKFYLMSDCLLYTTPYPNGQFKLSNELSLAGMKVSRPAQEDFQNEFSIISVQRSFTLSASTPELRDEWIGALNTAITDYAQKKSTFNLMRPDSVMSEGNLMSLGRKAPVWIPDGRVTMCMICTCEFTITWRRHHCRACGKVVCGNCSDNKLPLTYLSSKVARCCDECFTVLKKDCPEEEEKEEEVFTKTVKKKKNLTNKKKPKANRKMSRPSALKEVAANECNITMSGYLFQKGAKKKWNKYWYVIKDKVLYTYKASEDVAALESMPLLGYDIRVINEYYDGVEAGLVLQLFHQGRQIRMFRTESKVATEKWREAMHSATIL